LGLLLFLLFFIYSALGIELFGKLACTDSLPCDGLSEYANFNNFGMAMLVLFRLSTGDNWNGMMKDGLRAAPPSSTNATYIALYGNEYGCNFDPGCESDCCAGCNPDEECKVNCCASAALTPLYYISFCVMSTFVMLNLVVATLMGELEKAGLEDEEEDASGAPDSQAEVTPLEVVGTSEDHTEAAKKLESSAVGVVTTEPESVQSSPDPSPGSNSQSGEDSHASGSRLKLDPLPMRPASPTQTGQSVFVPFAPDTVDNDSPTVNESGAENTNNATQ